jgi:hypothetical protein
MWRWPIRHWATILMYILIVKYGVQNKKYYKKSLLNLYSICPIFSSNLTPVMIIFVHQKEGGPWTLIIGITIMLFAANRYFVKLVVRV